MNEEKKKTKLMKKFTPWLVRYGITALVSLSATAGIVDGRLSSLEAKQGDTDKAQQALEIQQAVTDKAQELYQKQILRDLDQIQADMHELRLRSDSIIDRGIK